MDQKQKSTMLSGRDHGVVKARGNGRACLDLFGQVQGHGELGQVELTILVQVGQLPDLAELGSGESSRSQDVFGSTSRNEAVLLGRVKEGSVASRILLQRPRTVRLDSCIISPVFVRVGRGKCELKRGKIFES